MTPEEALNVLSQVTGAVQADRRTHGQIQMALTVLQKMVDDAKDKKD
jgi:hypothetical protein